MKSYVVKYTVYNFIFCQSRLFLTTNSTNLYIRTRKSWPGGGAINKKVQNSMISIDTKGTLRQINLFHFVQQAIKYIVMILYWKSQV